MKFLFIISILAVNLNENKNSSGLWNTFLGSLRKDATPPVTDTKPVANSPAAEQKPNPSEANSSFNNSYRFSRVFRSTGFFN